jgi:chromosome segregation ATPase
MARYVGWILCLPILGALFFLRSKGAEELAAEKRTTATQCEQRQAELNAPLAQDRAEIETKEAQARNLERTCATLAEESAAHRAVADRVDGEKPRMTAEIDDLRRQIEQAQQQQAKSLEDKAAAMKAKTELEGEIQVVEIGMPRVTPRSAP